MPISKKHKEYEKTRCSKPISFNRINDARILSLVEHPDFAFGTWVKNILANLTESEMIKIKNDINLVPSMLVELSIENQHFDLDEYLLAKGLKIVAVHDDTHPQILNGRVDEFNQDTYQHDDFNQDFTY